MISQCIYLAFSSKITTGMGGVVDVASSRMVAFPLLSIAFC